MAKKENRRERRREIVGELERNIVGSRREMYTLVGSRKKQHSLLVAALCVLECSGAYKQAHFRATLTQLLNSHCTALQCTVQPTSAQQSAQTLILRL